eukprot:1825000-Prymnesium_polylepis.2
MPLTALSPCSSRHAFWTCGCPRRREAPIGTGCSSQKVQRGAPRSPSSVTACELNGPTRA